MRHCTTLALILSLSACERAMPPSVPSTPPPAHEEAPIEPAPTTTPEPAPPPDAKPAPPTPKAKPTPAPPPNLPTRATRAAPSARVVPPVLPGFPLRGSPTRDSVTTKPDASKTELAPAPAREEPERYRPQSRAYRPWKQEQQRERIRRLSDEETRAIVGDLPTRAPTADDDTDKKVDLDTKESP